MAAESFWNYAVDPRQHAEAAAAGMAAPAPVWQQSGHRHSAGPVTPPLPQPQVAPRWLRPAGRASDGSVPRRPPARRRPSASARTTLTCLLDKKALAFMKQWEPPMAIT